MRGLPRHDRNLRRYFSPMLYASALRIELYPVLCVLTVLPCCAWSPISIVMVQRAGMRASPSTAVKLASRLGAGMTSDIGQLLELLLSSRHLRSYPGLLTVVHMVHLVPLVSMLSCMHSSRSIFARHWYSGAILSRTALHARARCLH